MKRLFVFETDLTMTFILVGCASNDRETPIVTLKNNINTEFLENATEPNWSDFVIHNDNHDDDINLSIDESQTDIDSIDYFDVMFCSTYSSCNIANELAVLQKVPE